jgi:hypothetical protein
MIPSLHTGTIGFSKSERYLAEIVQRTFLGFWSHPNLFRSLAKELADLVVIFGDDVVVFSDKSCEYKDGDHGWSRWYRRAILDSAQQLHRAAGWLRKHPTEIYMDAKCERRFPLHVPASPRIHLIAVATGARQAAEQHFGGDGSLILHTHANGTEKFIVSDLDRSKEFVHVFDDFSLSIVLAELDTVSDFIAYLRKRTTFLRSGTEIYANSEFDLLAHYLGGMNDEHDFIVPAQDPPAPLIAVEGNWNDFVASGAHQRKKADDEESYVRDRIIEDIEDIAHHADQGTPKTGQEHGLAGNEEFAAGANGPRRAALPRTQEPDASGRDGDDLPRRPCTQRARRRVQAHSEQGLPDQRLQGSDAVPARVRAVLRGAVKSVLVGSSAVPSALLADREVIAVAWNNWPPEEVVSSVISALDLDETPPTP